MGLISRVSSRTYRCKMPKSASYTDEQWERYCRYNYDYSPLEAYPEDPNLLHEEFLNLIVKHFQFYENNPIDGDVKLFHKDSKLYHLEDEYLLVIYQVENNTGFRELLKPIKVEKLEKVTHLYFNCHETSKVMKPQFNFCSINYPHPMP